MLWELKKQVREHLHSRFALAFFIFLIFNFPLKFVHFVCDYSEGLWFIANSMEFLEFCGDVLKCEALAQEPE